MTLKNSEIKIIKSKKRKFDSRVYLGKSRIYQPIPGAPRIGRLFVWDEARKEYCVSVTAKSYVARRYEPDVNGKLCRKVQFFDSLDQARKWQAGAEEIYEQVDRLRESRAQTQTLEGGQAAMLGPRFSEVVEHWKRRKFPSLAASTQIAYEKILRLYFDDLLSLCLYEITPERIDQWLEKLKSPTGKTMKSARRITFKHEVGVLSAALRYYEDYHPDPVFHFPIKRRHWHDAKTGRSSMPKPKDLTEEEFIQFRSELAKGRYGHILASLATLQYFEALRISEAAGIFYEDIRINRVHPEKSRLFIQRSLHFPRVKGLETCVKVGFKNSKQFPDGVKELPMFPQTFEALAPLVTGKERGLMFQIDGKPIEYRTIQYFYDKAFRNAGLPYTATHVLRHGWTREVYNRNPDLDTAKQLLGDTSDDAARVYAKRWAGAITGVAQKIWAQKGMKATGENVRQSVAGENKHPETGCNWLQTQKPILKLVKN